MGSMARSKGARGEREIIDLLQPIVDAAYAEHNNRIVHDADRRLSTPQLKRTSSMQADGGGCDIHGIDWLALEVKRCETLQVGAWWEQCVRQARPGQLPVLVYRQNNYKWRVRLWLHDAFVCAVAEISLDDFMLYLHRALVLQLAWQAEHGTR